MEENSDKNRRVASPPLLHILVSLATPVAVNGSWGNLGQIRIVVLNLVIKAFAFDYADSILARRNRLFEEDYEWWETVTQWTIICVPCSFLAWYSLWLNYKEGLDSNLLNNIVSRYVPYVFRLPQGQLLFSPAMFKVSIIHFSITTSFLALAFPYHPWWARNKNLLHYGWVVGGVIRKKSSPLSHLMIVQNVVVVARVHIYISASKTWSKGIM